MLISRAQFLFFLVFAAASAHADDFTQTMKCDYRGILVDLKNGKTLPPEVSNYKVNGHRYSWKDEDKTFTVATGQLIRKNRIFPALSMDRGLITAGPSPNQTKESHSSVYFFSDPSYETVESRSIQEISVSIQSPGVKLVSDLNPDPALRAPDNLVTTKPLSGGNLSVISVAQGPSAPSNEMQYKTFEANCTYTPSSLSRVSFAGFFAKVKGRISKFNAKHGEARKASGALAACLAKNDIPCGELKKKLATANAARDAFWASMFSKEDLVSVPPAPPPHHGGGSDGGNEPSPPRTCSRDAECMNDESCVRGVCQWNRGPYSCNKDSDCPTFESCIRGACTDNSHTGGCVTNSDCGSGYKCGSFGRCEEDRDHPACGGDWQCGQGQTCQGGSCR